MQMPITAAIVNYNGQEYLSRLLPQVRAHGFHHIIVLDDASTDGSIEWLAAQSDITTVAGKENLGPVGNRNRILDFPTEEIILFLDNDVELLGADSAALLEAEFDRYPEAAVVGPLMVNHSDEPIWYNWGYQCGPYRLGVQAALNRIAQAHGRDPEVMTTVRKLAKGVVGHFELVESREVDWVAESFFGVRGSVFRALGGFDPAFHWYNEGPDYCLRARQAGYAIRFTTNLMARHLDQQSGTPEGRFADSIASSRHFYQKHYGITDEALWLQLRWR
jgi:N-acetylglucosaminyl-diphospho-decaprenol L-rhamnosyltransferase